jgi:hypothetical protein
MSTSLTVVVEKQRPGQGQDLYILPRVLDGLDSLAAQLGCTPLSTFVRDDPDLLAELADQLDEGTRERLAHKIENQPDWHQSSAGLAAVEKVLEFLQKAEPEDLPSQFSELDSDLVVKGQLLSEGKALAQAIGDELESCAKELRAAARKGRRFRFEIG